MSDELTTVLVELKCPVADKDTRPSPVEEFERFLARQKKPFAVEEYIVKKANLSVDSGWVEWFKEYATESEAFVAVFLVRSADKPYFDKLWAEWLVEKSNAAERSSK